MNHNLCTPIVCLLVLLFLLPFCAHSQDTLQSGISRDSAIRATLVKGYKYSQLVYTANGETLSNRDILQRLQLYPEPADELQQYRNAKASRFIWPGIMLGAAIGAGVGKSQNNPGVAYSFGGIFLGAMIGEFIAAARAERHLQQAIRIYNRRFMP